MSAPVEGVDSTISVVIPTYLRPDYLSRCVSSLTSQDRPPDEIIMVSRESDEPTNRRILELRERLGSSFNLVHGRVTKPGFLPPIRRGIALATSDIVAFIDDDAAAHPGWVRGLLSAYSSSDVGGVGGRIINMYDGVPAVYPKARVVGKISWFGRAVGNLYCDVTFEGPREVDFLMGGNMSFRRVLLEKVVIDPALEMNVATNWEMDVALQVKRLGYRVLFDPAIRADHFSGPREVDGLRSVNAEGRYWSNHNYSYLMMKHFSPARRLAYIVYSILIGSTGSGGIAYVLREILAGRRIDWGRDLVPSIKGRMHGVMRYFRTTST